MSNNTELFPGKSLADVRADFLVLPKHMQDYVKRTFGLNVTKAQILERTTSPKEFCLGPGKEVFVLEYGILCVNVSKEKGFGWCCADTRTGSRHKCSRCGEINYFTSTTVKSKCTQYTYCSDRCKNGEIHIRIADNE